jgi:hypothetical protein
VTHHLKNISLCVLDERPCSFGKQPCLDMFVVRKFESILYLLERGMNVVYADTDIVFLKDPMKYAPDKSKGYSVAIQMEGRMKWEIRILCTGFIFADATEDAIWLFKTAKYILTTATTVTDDQDALNQLQNNRIYGPKFDKINQVLDICLFPNGIRYFEDDVPRCNWREAVIVHSNWAVGGGSKNQKDEVLQPLVSTTTNNDSISMVIRYFPERKSFFLHHSY